MSYYNLISSMLKAVISTLGIGLYAVYKAESNANDSLGTYNGTPYGGLTYGTGKNGNCFIGNGTTASVNLPNNMFNSFTGDFSFSMWINMATNTSGFKTLISNNKLLLSPTRQYGFGFYLNNTTVRFQKYNGTSTALTMEYDLTSSFTTNIWHNLVFTYSTTLGRKIYFNGTLVASNSDLTAIAYDSIHYPTIMAQRYDGVNYEYFNPVKMDEVAIWNTRALTATEVTELYNAGAGKFYPTF